MVGGGVIGLCTAYYAMKQGHRVTVIERGGPAHDSCSLGNAGMIVPSHFIPLAAPGMVALGAKMMLRPRSPFYVRPRPDADLIRWGALFAKSATAAHVANSAPILRDLHLASRARYQELARDLGDDFGFTKNGLLMLCKTQSALQEEAHTAEMACKLGMEAKVLTPLETARVDPEITMDIAGSVYFPQDGHLTPQIFIERLTKALEAGGVSFLWGAEVTGWGTASGRIVSARTDAGEVAADEYVLAGGAWSPRTVRDLGIRLPMQAGKGYSLTLPKPPQTPRVCSILMEARVAVTPMLSGLRIGGTMEVTGLDLSISWPRVDGILESVPKYFPRFAPGDFENVPVWSGLRPCSPDGMPYVGRFDRYRNLIAATGHAMMGISLGPATGEILADILSDHAPKIDIGALSPDRFH
ncbi:amino acid dehydrogenase [Capsulimonas corticalis]|uniref:Amino acid dehydrogenase n=1 Tax=Capsulimonas corticalis TaxID=2219043 RepID=A0A402D6I6_9BACT|nr:amino acid dehydrogenase [Capsulimonas corticalis]